MFEIEITSANLKRVCDWWRYYKKTNIVKNNAKILIYDIETTLIKAHVWWTGKQYISHNQLLDESKIITIAYKWLGEDSVECLVWDNNKKCDKELIKEFLEVYNQADAVIGVNNDRFDNKFINARAAKYNYDVNTFIKSIDILKQARKLFRLPSYSMKYLAKYFELTLKLEHEGIDMWKKIQYQKGKESELALEAMVEYNLGDIVTTEEIYNKLIKYAEPLIHQGVVQDNPKFSCPDTGSNNVRLYKTTYTKAGTKQRIMISSNGRKFKISETEYKKYLNANN